MIYVRVYSCFGCRVIASSADSSNEKKSNFLPRVKEQLSSELVHNMYTTVYLYVVYNYIPYTLRLQEVKSGILVCVYINMRMNRFKNTKYS